jgi:hypothetical protein
VTFSPKGLLPVCFLVDGKIVITFSVALLTTSNILGSFVLVADVCIVDWLGSASEYLPLELLFP